MTDTSGGLPPAGWYPDPYGAPHERWWDGQQWTEHTNVPEPQPSAEQPPAFAEPVFQAPVYEQPAYEQPAYEQPVYEQPTYDPAPFEQPAYDQLGYQQPAFEQPVFEQPVFEQPVFEQPAFEQTTVQQPPFEAPTFAQPVWQEEQPFQQPPAVDPQQAWQEQQAAWQREQDAVAQAAQEAQAAQAAPQQPAFDAGAWGQPIAAEPEPWQQPAAAAQPDPFAAPADQGFVPPPFDEPAYQPPAFGDLFGAAPAAPASAAQQSYQQPAAAQQPAFAQQAAFEQQPYQQPGGSPAAASPFQGAATPSGAPDFGQLIAGGAGGDADGFGDWATNEYEDGPRNGAATAALVFGVLSFILSAVAGIFGLIFGFVGLARSNTSGVGRGKATAGILLALVGSIATIGAGFYFQPQLLAAYNSFTGTSATGDGTGTGTGDSTKTANGNIPLTVGQKGVIKDASGAAAITFTVTSIQPDPTCTAPEEDQLSAENGQFIAVGLSFETSADYVSVMNTGALMQLNSQDWTGYGADGTQLVNSDAGLSCLTAAEQVPLDIPAGATTTGTYVLDLATGATSIAWSPSDVTSVVADASRWEWPTISAN